METKRNLFDLVDSLTEEVTKRESELRAEKQRLTKVLEEAKTASERLKQIDALILVAESSGRMGAVKSPRAHAPATSTSLPQRVRSIFAATKGPLSSGEVIDRLNYHGDKGMSGQTYAVINKLVKTGFIKVEEKDGKRLYQLSENATGGGGQ